MEFRCPVADLSAALALVQGVAGRKNTMPILSHVLVDVDEERGLTLSSTDLDISVRTSIECETNAGGSACMPAKALAAMVREMSGPDVAIKQLPNKHVEVRSGKTKARLSALAADDFPTLPEVGGASLDIAGALLGDIIDRTLFAACEDTTRHNMCGVHLEVGDGDEATFVATDGHRLSLLTRKIDGISAALGGRTMTLPRRGLDQVARVLGTDGTVGITTDGVHLTMRAGATLLTTRPIDGVYPDFRQVVPKTHEGVLRVRTADFVDSLKRVNVLALDRMSGVKLALGKGGAVVSCANLELGEVSDEVPGEYAGPKLEVGFNARYMIDALESLQAGMVELRLTNEVSPGLLCAEGDERHMAVVMPMRL
jgi:DNA polymerase-3 subunit beta